MVSMSLLMIGSNTKRYESRIVKTVGKVNVSPAQYMKGLPLLALFLLFTCKLSSHSHARTHMLTLTTQRRVPGFQ